MTTALETFRAEMFARVQMGTYTPAVDPDSIRRSRKTNVHNDRCPAIYLSFPEAECVKANSCEWQWRVRYRAVVFTADDAGDAASDLIVDGVLAAINPEASESTATPLYSNGVTISAAKVRVRVDEDTGDEDPTQVVIEGEAIVPSQPWRFAA